MTARPFATEDLLQDHVFIRRLQSVIEKCHVLLSTGRDVPFADLVRIADLMEQFVDQLHHGKEEAGYFPKAEHTVDEYSQEIRRFVLEHEFGRRIAKRVRIHLEQFLQSRDAGRGPLARYLKTYSVFILDHTAKEDRFFRNVRDRRSLSDVDEKDLKERFEVMRHQCIRKSGDLIAILEQLEKAEWAAPA